MKRTRAITTVCLVFTLILFPILAVLVFTLPALLKHYFAYDSGEEIIRHILIAFYVCVPIGFAALALLSKILYNLLKEKLFIRQNAICFRWLSICALYVGVVCIVAGISTYFPLLLIALTAFFIGLLLQVLVRLLLTACEISEENQLTI